MQTKYSEAMKQLESGARAMTEIFESAGVVKADLTEAHRQVLAAIDDEASAHKLRIHNLEKLAGQLLKSIEDIECKETPAGTAPQIALAAE